MNADLSAFSPRERILKTASGLFYNQGFRAIGIDRIIAESGVAKMTFYKHFPSKDNLIAEYMRVSTAQFWIWMNEVIDAHETPIQKLEAMFDGIAKVASGPQCMGCAFMHAAAEFPDLNHPGHAAALAHKQKMLDKLLELSLASKVRDPQGLAQDLMMVTDGAWSAVRMFGSGNYAARLGKTARILIAAQLSTA